MVSTTVILTLSLSKEEPYAKRCALSDRSALRPRCGIGFAGEKRKARCRFSSSGLGHASLCPAGPAESVAEKRRGRLDQAMRLSNLRVGSFGKFRMTGWFAGDSPRPTKGNT
jgi:hypothetical protein